jgi:spermidine synthase
MVNHKPSKNSTLYLINKMCDIEIQERSDPKNIQVYRGKFQAMSVNEHQTWTVIHHEEHGQMLFIDDHHQSSQIDEHIYHESFVHSLLSGIHEPKHVLILGGSEGCIAREVLRWPTIEKITQVDWDKTLCDWFKQNGIAWHKGAYSDSRLITIHMEALSWLLNNQSQYDAIFVDLFDPTPMEVPFFKEILRLCKRMITCKGGIAVNVGGVPQQSTALLKQLTAAIQNEYSVSRFQLFATHVDVPSFLGEWCFLVAAPKSWAAVIHDTELPRGLMYFNKDRLIQMVSWSADAPSELRDFWKYEPAVNPAEKLAASQPKSEGYTGSLEYYGC